MRLSVSQIKTYNASPAKRAWLYILWIKEDYSNDAMLLWQAFENWLITKHDNLEKIIWNKEVEDMEKFVQDYDTLKFNAEWTELNLWKQQVRVQGKLFGLDFIWYIDNLTDERVEDIKTTRYLTKPDSKSKNMWSGMTTMEEYELQLWIYCKLLWRKKWRILEFAKHRYKDNRKASQIIELEITDEFDKEMEVKYWKIIEEMKKLYNKYK